MTRLTYFEPQAAGHCAFWANILLDAAARDERVTNLRLVTGADLIDRLQPTIAAHDVNIDVLSVQELSRLNEGALLARGCAQWAKARELLEWSGGQLFLPFFDHALYGSIFDRRPVRGQISGVIFRPPNDFGLPNTLRRRLDALRRCASYLAARRSALRALFTLDERAAESCRLQTLPLLRFAPDPAPDLATLPAAPPLASMSSRRIILLFGALTRRKGIFKMLEAVPHLTPVERAGLELRFVGRLDAQDRSEFIAAFEATRAAHSGIALTLIDRYVPDRELADEIARCDVIFAPYQNHLGSSGVVYWAVAAGKPLVSQDTGYMGWQAYTYGVGEPINTTDAVQLARAMVRPLTMPADASVFLSRHTHNAFAGAILDGILQDQ